MTKRELAEGYFIEGYNCTQSVVLAFEDEIGVDRNTLLRLSASFGGGFGRLRELCGCVSGMGVVIGALHPYDAKDIKAKAEHYALVQKLAGKFREKNGSIVCREILGAKLAATNPEPEARTPEYYKIRPCAKLAGDAAEILSDWLAGKL